MLPCDPSDLANLRLIVPPDTDQLDAWNEPDLRPPTVAMDVDVWRLRTI